MESPIQTIVTIRYLFDTDILIDHLRGFRNIVEVIRFLSGGVEELGISIISITEVYAGIQDAERKNIEEAETLLARFVPIVPDYEIAKQAGWFCGRYGVELGDALIAASAYASRATLITRNLKHFRKIKEIQVIAPEPHSPHL